MPASFHIARTGFAIRPAADADTKAARMLLPDVPLERCRLVAVDRKHQLVVGAAAATRVPRQKPLVGPGVAVHVIEPCRRCGIGGALVEELAVAARRQGAEALYAIQKVELDSTERRGWEWLGFRVCATVQQHRLPLEQFEPRLAPMVDQMVARGRIPAGAEIVPLYAADAEAVVQLHLATMGGDRETLLARIRGDAPSAFHPRYSRVLLLDGRVVGCILGHRKSREVMRVDANVLAPEVRRGWANAWLKLEATRGALSLGITHFEFTSFDHYADTRRFTEKLGGTTTRTLALMYRPLVSDPRAPFAMPPEDARRSFSMD